MSTINTLIILEVGFEQPCRAAKLSPVAMSQLAGAAALREGWRAGLRAPAPGLQGSLCRTPIPEQAVLTMPAASGLLVLRDLRSFMPFRLSGLHRMPVGPDWARWRQTDFLGKVLGSLLLGGWWLRSLAGVVAGVIWGHCSKCT